MRFVDATFDELEHNTVGFRTYMKAVLAEAFNVSSAAVTVVSVSHGSIIVTANVDEGVVVNSTFEGIDAKIIAALGDDDYGIGGDIGFNMAMPMVTHAPTVLHLTSTSAGSTDHLNLFLRFGVPVLVILLVTTPIVAYIVVTRAGSRDIYTGVDVHEF